MDQLGTVDELHAEGDFFGAGDLEPLPLLDDLDEIGCLQQRFGRTGVQPGHAAAKNAHLQCAFFHIDSVQVCDLDLPTCGGSDLFGKGRYAGIIKIQAGDGEV